MSLSVIWQDEGVWIVSIVGLDRLVCLAGGVDGLLLTT